MMIRPYRMFEELVLVKVAFFCLGLCLGPASASVSGSAFAAVFVSG
jgi:hypothetical protein